MSSASGTTTASTSSTPGTPPATPLLCGKLVVGLLGCGTVGGGVVELLRDFSHSIRIKKICVADLTKKREGVTIPVGCEIVKDVMSVVADEEINCIVEVMGGTGIAKDAMIKALKLGKHVVTANKAAIAGGLDEFNRVVQEQKHKTAFMYEAAVCGGIPIISVVRRALSCDQISKVVGIMNGTTNYMLTRMEKEGVPYQAVLADAQQKGYAEADPSADVDGYDARSKLCILTKLAFGLTVDENEVFCDGIQRITNVDFEYAKMINHTIKLLSISEKCERHEGGHVVHMSVSPVMVPLDHPLGRIDGVTNVVQLMSKNLDSSLYVGPGAGRRPTANSIVSDILEIQSRLPPSPLSSSTKGESFVVFPPAFPTAQTARRLETDFTADFFIRFVVSDQCGVVRRIAGLCEKHKISIFSLLQTPITDPTNVPFVIVTDSCKLSQVTAFCDEIDEQRKAEMSFVKQRPMFIRYYK
eukprot:GHVS01081828.1.p1 GENE.GHVS01081828.1~~GHVS01081828.1.p1  ORF type:complete len:470 (-),score=83.64 GHVS01081828.1:428-1837(-)